MDLGAFGAPPDYLKQDPAASADRMQQLAKAASINPQTKGVTKFTGSSDPAPPPPEPPPPGNIGFDRAPAGVADAAPPLPPPPPTAPPLPGPPTGPAGMPPDMEKSTFADVRQPVDFTREMKGGVPVPPGPPPPPGTQPPPPVVPPEGIAALANIFRNSSFG